MKTKPYFNSSQTLRPNTFKTAPSQISSLLCAALLLLAFNAMAEPGGHIVNTFTIDSEGAFSHFSSSPAIGLDGSIYICTADSSSARGVLYKLDSCNLTKIWSLSDGAVGINFLTGDGCSSSPSVGPNGAIYLGGGGGVVAVKPDSTALWSQFDTTASISGDVLCAPTIGGDGTIYLASDDGSEIAALSPADGSLIWSFSFPSFIPSDVDSSPAIGTNGILVALGEHNNYFTGFATPQTPGAVQPAWVAGITSDFQQGGQGLMFQNLAQLFPGDIDSRATIPHFNSSPAIGADGTFYVGGCAGLYAVNTNGTIKWVFTPSLSNPLGQHGVQSSPAIGPDGTIYFGGDDGVLYAITDNGCSASQLWMFAPPWTNLAPVLSSPAITEDNTIYITMRNTNGLTDLTQGQCNSVFFAVTNGSPQWSITLSNFYISCSPTIGWDGTVYIADHTNLYAIKSTNAAVPLSPLASSPWPMFHHDPQHTGRAGIVPPSPKWLVDVQFGYQWWNIKTGPAAFGLSSCDGWNQLLIPSGELNGPAGTILASTSCSDSEGNSTSITVSLQSASDQVSYSGATTGSSLDQLINACIDTKDINDPSYNQMVINISSLPSGTYDLYLYGVGNGPNGLGANISCSCGDSDSTSPNLSVGDYVRGNQYVLFSGVSPDGYGNISITASPNSSDSYNPVGLNGIQIVAH